MTADFLKEQGFEVLGHYRTEQLLVAPVQVEKDVPFEQEEPQELRARPNTQHALD